MAGITDLGGLFFQLGLVPDKNSFETGYRLIDGTVNKFSMLIGTARNAANVMASMATEAGKADSALYKTSTKLGLTAEVLNTWKAAAKIAGISADGLVASMGELSYALNNIRSEGLGKYADQLTKIGMGLDQLKDKEGKWLQTDAAYTAILEHARAKYNGAGSDEEKLQIQNAVSDILGGAGFDLFLEILKSGKSTSAYLAEAGTTQFQTNESMNEGQSFITEWRKFKTSIESISNLLGDKTGGALADQMKAVNEWLNNNGDAIKNAIDNIASLIGKIANSKVTQDAGKLASAMVKLIGGDTAGALEDVRNTNFATAVRKKLEIQKDIDEWLIENGKIKHAGFYTSEVKLSELPADLQMEVLGYLSQHKFVNIGGVKLKDGIMRPDGTVTQVAPDDWVFAARNLGDLARAFIPQGTATGPGDMEVSIVQNFTISGASDMPQVLRQQAYQGTQDGLMQIMAQSSRRLQLMSGTR